MKFLKTASLILICSAILCIGSHAAGNEEVDEIMKSIVFFGDSTTAHLAVRGGIERDRVWSGVGSTMLYTSVLDKSVKIGDEIMSLPEAVSRFKPKIIVITVGASGGAGFLKEESFKNIYSKLIDSVKTASPQTKIIIQSILPLSDKSKKYYKKLTKQAVVTSNKWIEDVCREKNVPYLNTHALLTDENGYLKKEYQNDEYLHLTAAAYKVILQNIKNHISNNIEKYK